MALNVRGVRISAHQQSGVDDGVKNLGSAVTGRSKENGDEAKIRKKKKKMRM